MKRLCFLLIALLCTCCFFVSCEKVGIEQSNNVKSEYSKYFGEWKAVKEREYYKENGILKYDDYIGDDMAPDFCYFILDDRHFYVSEYAFYGDDDCVAMILNYAIVKNNSALLSYYHKRCISKFPEYSSSDVLLLTEADEVEYEYIIELKGDELVLTELDDDGEHYVIYYKRVK